MPMGLAGSGLSPRQGAVAPGLLCLPFTGSLLRTLQAPLLAHSTDEESGTHLLTQGRCQKLNQVSLLQSPHS